MEVARVLALLGDSVTTDHISPAGAIPLDSTARSYLAKLGIAERDFDSYGSRRGNNQVMARRTSAIYRLLNRYEGFNQVGNVRYKRKQQMAT
jgi:aconitate hydratase